MDRLSEDERCYVERLRKDYFNDILEAVRAGLIWHPRVYDLVYTHRALGNKEMLRQIKRGWETGVERPLTENDIKFENNIDKITRWKAEGKTWKEVRRNLMKLKIIGKMSLPGLQKKYERARKKLNAPAHLPLPVLIPPIR